MPIVESRAAQIRRLIADLDDPARREAATARLRTMGARVPGHVEEDLVRLSAAARTSLIEVLRGVETADARAVLQRLERAATRPGGRPGPPVSRTRSGDPSVSASGDGDGPDAEASALAALRAHPPAQARESAAVSRARGEAHLALARAGSRLARKDLLHCLETLGPERGRLYCEAAGLIGDAAFVPVLAGLATGRPDGGAGDALMTIAARERLTARSKVVKDLADAPRAAALAAIAAGRTETKAR